MQMKNIALFLSLNLIQSLNSFKYFKNVLKRNLQNWQKANTTCVVKVRLKRLESDLKKE